jgi:hypothetical protein
MTTMKPLPYALVIGLALPAITHAQQPQPQPPQNDPSQQRYPYYPPQYPPPQQQPYPPQQQPYPPQQQPYPPRPPAQYPQQPYPPQQGYAPQPQYPQQPQYAPQPQYPQQPQQYQPYSPQATYPNYPQQGNPYAPPPPPKPRLNLQSANVEAVQLTWACADALDHRKLDVARAKCGDRRRSRRIFRATSCGARASSPSAAAATRSCSSTPTAP